MLRRTPAERRATDEAAGPSPFSDIGARSAGRSGLAARVTGEEDQPVLADLDLVGVLEGHLGDAVAVDVRAVEAPGVRDGEVRALAGEHRVPAGDSHVVEEDLAVVVL